MALGIIGAIAIAITAVVSLKMVGIHVSKNWYIDWRAARSVEPSWWTWLFVTNHSAYRQGSSNTRCIGMPSFPFFRSWIWWQDD